MGNLSTPHDVQKLPMASHAKDGVRSCPRAGCGKSACPVVCPAKAGMFAGERPAGARVRSPVVWIAGWRETKTLKPIDNVSLGKTTSHRAVTTVNAKVASKVRSPEGRVLNRRAKAAWGSRNLTDAAPSLRGWKRQHGGKDMPSNWRSPPRPSAKSPEQGRSYNRLNREVDRRREGDGWVRSSGEAG